MARILIVDDDPTQRRLLEAVVGRLGYDMVSADCGEAALKILRSGDPEIDLMLLDLIMPDLSGTEVMERIAPSHSQLPVIVLTAQSGVDVIVTAMRSGALDFIVKPANPERLKVSIENALKIKGLTGQVSKLTRQMTGEMSFDDLIVKSPSMNEVIRIARRGADSSIPILIEGESGVGKEVMARAIQGSGERAGRPFIAVNCGAIPENLVESILFGHEKGAFTGASSKHTGKFKEADGGTLFLDEIGELRSDIQVKLLRALQEKEIDPIGAKRPEKVDVRLISATNKNLQAMVEAGSFREDLFYRLNVFPIYLPALRERREDILPLAEYFIASFSASENKAVAGVSNDARNLLLQYDWPGNVRQLENAVFRAVVLNEGGILGPVDFPQIAQSLGVEVHRQAEPGDPGMALAPPDLSDLLPILDLDGEVRPLEELESEIIRKALEHYDGQMSEVARKLKIGRSTLYRKIKEQGLDARG